MWSGEVAKGSHGILVQTVVTPELFPRLSQLSKSFQRIRYHRLRFEVVASWPSTAGGAYVAGFVKDATDPVHSLNAATTLLASGGTATKVWQSTEVIVNSLPDLYYTSSDSNSVRWSSPGSFVAALMSKTTDSGSLQVYAHWDVSLSEPTYETPDNADDGYAVLNVDAYTSQGNAYLSKRNGSDWTPLLPSDFFPALKSGDKLHLVSFRYASVASTGGALNGLFGFHTLSCTAGAVYPVDDQGNYSTQKFFDEVYVLSKGERAQIGRETPNVQRAPWFISTRPALRPLLITAPWLLAGRPFPPPAPHSPCSDSSWPPCSTRTDQDITSLTSKELATSSSPLMDASRRAPPSNQATLSRLLEQLTPFLRSSQERSPDSLEEFEMVPLQTEAQIGDPPTLP